MSNSSNSYEQAHPDVIVVGAGIAGLVCAVELTRAGKSVLVLESESEVGGRVRTTQKNGFIIDHGFQVLFTAYPTIMSYLDVPALHLRAFRPAAHVVVGNRVSLIGDALRDKTLLMDTVSPGVISMADKLRLLALRRFAKHLSIEECFGAQFAAKTTRAFLMERGFSEEVVNAFFAPFYGGILLDRTLETSASVLLFTFKMLSEGETVLPSRGMQAIPEQLASQLPSGSIRFGVRVQSVRTDGLRATGVTLADGSEIVAGDVVVATDLFEATRLVSRRNVVAAAPPRGSTSLYFRSARTLLPGKSLWLNGDVNAIISHAVTITEVAPEYANSGALTVATAVGPAANLGDVELERAARTILSHFASVSSLNANADLALIDIQRVPLSQFAQLPNTRLAQPKVDPDISGLWQASEFLHSSSIEGAARGGRMAAMALLEASVGITR